MSHRIHAIKLTKANFLNGYHYANTTKNTIVYRHKSWGGIGYFDPYTEQGLSNVKTFVITIQDKSIAGKLLRAAVRTWQWKIGSVQNPFQSSYEYPQDETKWLKQVSAFAQQNQITISIGKTEYSLLREHKQYIVDVAEQDSVLMFCGL
jgi:hypothetical protein